MEKVEPKEFRYGVPEDIYGEWRALHKRTGVAQVQILHRLIRFLLSHDQVTQQMILGLIDARPDLIEFVLKRPRKAKPFADARTTKADDRGRD